MPLPFTPGEGDGSMRKEARTGADAALVGSDSSRAPGSSWSMQCQARRMEVVNGAAARGKVGLAPGLAA